MTPRVALATCSAFPRLTDDDPLLLDALRARGIDAEPAVWDAPEIDWSSYTLVVIRSTWDYVGRREQYVEWARALPRVLNRADVVEWNTDKRYLGQLPRAVPTEFLAPGEPFRAPPGEYVIKPSVSAGSRDTARYGPGEDARARAHVERLLIAGRTVMVQPYLQAVDDRGETALLFFGGEYSHAICKGQLLHRSQAPSDLPFMTEQISPREPDRTERAVAEEVVDSLPWPRSALLYARVDLIADHRGEPKLVELELTEPSLFLSYAEGAAERLADRVLERI